MSSATGTATVHDVSDASDAVGQDRPRPHGNDLPPIDQEPGLVRCPAAGLLRRLYRSGRRGLPAFHAARVMEGGYMRSATIRHCLADHHGVRVGAYSYGPCTIPGAWPRGVTVGRYCSIAPGVLVYRRNHPYQRLSTHPFFYNRLLGYVPRDTITQRSLWIGHDAWIGANTIITPGCRRIGLGAVVGAGAVVTRDVPDFAIVAGTPAKVLRYRFDDATQRRFRDSRWWQLPVEAILPHLDAMQIELDDAVHHPLLDG